MSLVTVRHFTEQDIRVRSELMRETRFQANLNDVAVLMADEALIAKQRRTIAEEHQVKRTFTLCGAAGETVGFAWISSIDWRSQTCELSFAVLPRFRGAFGATAVAAAQRYVREELNMRVIINQVLEHNTMLVPAGQLASRHQVRCAFDSYTLGEWRTACYWTESEQDIRAEQERMGQRRRELARRIQARAQGKP